MMPDWSLHEDAALTAMWNRGASIKRIALEVGRTEGAVKKRRIAIGLPTRKSGALTKNVKVNVDDATYRKIGALAMARGMHVTEYVRNLILREIGLRS